MKIYQKIEELIGNTPLLNLNKIKTELQLKCNIFAKLECFNPAGSIKDRAVLYMIDGAIKNGELKEGGTIIEPTSGNTGIGLASISASRGYKAVLTMPDTMSVERIKLLKSYGATVVLTDGKLGMKGAIEKAEEIKAKTPNSIILGQFSNPLNKLAHYQTTAKEIIRDTDGKIDFFVAGVGSGGTVSGTGKYLKEINENIKVIGVEPDSSPLITKGVSGAHKIQGIGANFIPDNFDNGVVDKVMTATDTGAYKCANLVAKKEGLLVGISSGANLSVAISLAKMPENEGKNIVVIFPDTGDRYLSTDLYD